MSTGDSSSDNSNRTESGVNLELAKTQVTARGNTLVLSMRNQNRRRRHSLGKKVDNSQDPAGRGLVPVARRF